VPLTLLTRPLKGALNAGWVRNRVLAGTKEIHKGMGNLFAAVRHGEALGILIDQNMLLKRAVFVPFFGKLAATTPAPAVVSLRTGCQVLLALLLRRPDGRYATCFEGPFRLQRTAATEAEDIRAFTLMLNERFERIVREHPEQWFWLHRRWKTRPPGEPTGTR
jgi:KDO2-lipid IV(A) lauroyltransferase